MPINNCGVAIEADDVRGATEHTYEQVAIYDPTQEMRYRSRIAEIARLLHCNYQRFQMAPSTGLLRYERRPQRRPVYCESIQELIQNWCASVGEGHFDTNGIVGLDASYSIDSEVNSGNLTAAIEAVLSALAQIFEQRGRGQHVCSVSPRGRLHRARPH